MIEGLDHLHMICGNVEEGVQYFEKMFDGRVVSRGEIRGLPAIRVDVKGILVTVMGTAAGTGQLIPGKGSRGLDHFGFRVKDLVKTVEDLKKRGATFGVDVTAGAGGIKFAFVDGPDGSRIELVERS